MDKKKSNITFQKGKGFTRVSSRSSITGFPNSMLIFMIQIQEN